MRSCTGIRLGSLLDLWELDSGRVNCMSIPPPPSGGGGGGLAPNIDRYVPQQKWKIGGSGASWALWPVASCNPEATFRLAAYKPAVGGDERLEGKEIWKIMVCGAAKKCKMVMLRSGFFLSFLKMICSVAEIKGWKWGSLAWHIPNMHICGSAPPPDFSPKFNFRNIQELQSTLLKSNPLGLKIKLRMKENLPYVKPKQLKLNSRGLVQAFDLGNFYGNLT